METFLSIVVWVLMGWLTSYFAQQRGRDALIWFFIGLVLGIFGLILLFLLPKFDPKDPSTVPAQKSSGENDTLEIQPLAASKIPVELDLPWFYVDLEHKQQGPIFVQDLQRLWKDQRINADTFMWHEGMDNWKRVAELATLYQNLKQSEEPTD